MDIDELRKMKAQRKKAETSSYVNDSNRRKTGTPEHSAEAERHFHIAECYYDGLEGYQEDYAKAIKEYLIAAELGHTKAMVKVADDYANKDFSELGFNLDKAEMWARKAIELGHPDAYKSLFDIFKARGKGHDAVKALETGASKGSLDCIEWLSLLLYWGDNIAGYQVEEDEDRAFELLKSINWDNDHSTALVLLGDIYRNCGDISNAIEYYEKALIADNKCYWAMASLGNILRNDESVRDYQRAKTLLENAAYKGNVIAMNGLGLMLYFGEDCRQDKSAAIEWFKKAALNGHPGAMINLGDILADENREEAIYWYKCAADGGNSVGEERLNDLQNDDAGNDTSRFDRQQAQSNDEDYIKNRVMDIISERFDIDRDYIHSFSSFERNLKADRLAVVKLIIEIEKEFGIYIPDSESKKFRTVGDLICYIKYNC